MFFFCLFLCFAFFVFGGEKLFLLLLLLFLFNKLSVGGIHALGDLYEGLNGVVAFTVIG